MKEADGRKFLELFQTPMSRTFVGQTTGDRKVFDAARKAYQTKMRAAYDPVNSDKFTKTFCVSNAPYISFKRCYGYI